MSYEVHFTIVKMSQLSLKTPKGGFLNWVQLLNMGWVNKAFFFLNKLSNKFANA